VVSRGLSVVVTHKTNLIKQLKELVVLVLGLLELEVVWHVDPLPL
jgi:hypothetical protein